MRDLDVEWIAFAAGLKPALRRTVEPTRAAEVAARLAGPGAHVLEADQPASLAGRPTAVLYIARSAAEAASLREAERLILPGTAERLTAGERRAAHHALGIQLGFPDCCVEAFCSRVDRGVDRLSSEPVRGLSEDYVALREAWTVCGDARVNNLLMAIGAQIVSHYPCRYDCAASIAQAVRLLEVLARDAPAQVASLESRLSGVWVVAADGARARATLDAQGRVTAAEAPNDPRSEPDARDATLGRGLPGARVGADGRVVGLRCDERAPPWCVRFQRWTERSE